MQIDFEQLEIVEVGYEDGEIILKLQPKDNEQIGHDELTVVIHEVQSRTRDFKHRVFEFSNETYHCTCEAFRYGKGKPYCNHIMSIM